MRMKACLPYCPCSFSFPPKIRLLVQMSLTNSTIYIILQYQMIQPQYKAAVHCLVELLKRTKDPKSSTISPESSCIVALFTSDDSNPLRFSGKIGLLQIDFDRQIKVHFLRFYDIDSLNLLMEIEMYYQFASNYRKGHKQTFYIFDMFVEGVIGFEFRNKEEAELMAKLIKIKAPKQEEYKQLLKERQERQNIQKKQSGFFSKMKKKVGNLMHGEQQQKQESVILKIVKQELISMNCETGMFNFSDSPFMSEILTSSGLTKKDLQNQEIAKIVFEETIMHQAKKTAQQNHAISKQHFVLIKNGASEQQSITDVDKDQSTMTSIQQTKQQNEQVKFLPSENNSSPSIPPPPPIFNLAPPPPLGEGDRLRQTCRNDLMQQIRKKNLKLNKVKTNQKSIEMDLSSMNKQQRNDLASHIRSKLQLRKKALARRDSNDERQNQQNA